MEIVFWDRKGILMVECLQQGTTITSEVYCETLNKLRRAIQNKRRRMTTPDVVFLHDNARPNTDTHPRAMLEQWNRELFEHSSYRPDLAPSDYHLFTFLPELDGITAVQQ
jgi:transposase